MAFSQPHPSSNVTAVGTYSDRMCAFDFCNELQNLKLCSRCKGTWYCSKEHQKQHWKVHKTSCGKMGGQQQETTGKKKDEKTLKTSQMGRSTNSGSKSNIKKISEQNTNQRDNVKDGGRLTPSSKGSGMTDKSDMPSSASCGTDDVKHIEDSQVQEDIAQFSANIRRKHSYTLTPCKSEKDDISCAQQKGTERENNSDPMNNKVFSKEQENSLSGKKAGGGGSDNGSVERNTNALVRYVSDHMRRFGVCVVDKFLRQDLGDAIIEEVKALRENNKFQSGQLVTSVETGSSKDIRGDMITWSDGSTLQTKNIGALISKIDLIIQQCKEHLEGFKNVNGRTEAMIACYPGNGTHYVKHVDNPNEDGRCVTCIYYLNKGWDSEKMGGTLQLYPRDHKMMASIEPIFNRLIVFWSNRRNPHEVLPAYNTRYAITVWYFDSVERKKALETALS